MRVAWLVATATKSAWGLGRRSGQLPGAFIANAADGMPVNPGFVPGRYARESCVLFFPALASVGSSLSEQPVYLLLVVNPEAYDPQEVEQAGRTWGGGSKWVGLAL